MLKPGGHFSISDVVLRGNLPEGIKQAAEMYAGCISGAIQKQEYMSLIEAAGFINTSIQKAKPIVIPADILSKYLNPAEILAYHAEKSPVCSITVYAEKPAKAACCGPDCCNL